MRPNLLCVGTYRSGTTWLYEALCRHPDVFVPEEKELMFFSHHYQRGYGWYESLYRAYAGQRYAADISPPYLSCEEAPARMREGLPGARIVVTLRNPADQVWSRYNLMLTRGKYSGSVQSALEEKEGLLDDVLYFKHVSRYLEHFARQDLCVLFYEDLRADPRRFLETLCDFLEIPGFYPEDLVQARNVSRKPRNMFVEKVIVRVGDSLRRSGMLTLKSLLNRTGVAKKLKALNTAQAEMGAMPPDARTSVNQHVARDREQLAQLLGRDLSSWH